MNKLIFRFVDKDGNDVLIREFNPLTTSESELFLFKFLKRGDKINILEQTYSIGSIRMNIKKIRSHYIDEIIFDIL